MFFALLRNWIISLKQDFRNCQFFPGRAMESSFKRWIKNPNGRCNIISAISSYIQKVLEPNCNTNIHNKDTF